MKKWFVGLMVLLTLVLASSTAMAVADYRVCSNCWEYRNGTTEYITDPKEMETSWDMHTDRIFTCSVCSVKTKLWSLHYGGGATCTTEGTCDFCHVPYKDSSVHTGPYTYSYSKTSDTRHNVKATCTGCRSVARTYSAKHEEAEAATCKTVAYCGLCRSRYGEKDPDNHAGKAYTISATKISETLHTPKLWYECCGYMFDGDPTEHRILDEATCINEAYCVYCRVKVGTRNPDNHVGTPTTTYAKTSETQHTAKITYSGCKHMVDGASTDHTETTAATCLSGAYCADCKSYYGEVDPDAHDLESHGAQAPTCTEVGWEAYQTCTREGCGYTTYEEIPMLVHWYAEWMPNADATHTASCKRGYEHQKTVDCTQFTYTLTTGNERVEVTLCPVCGEVSDGTRLMLAEAAAKAVTGKLPAGEIVVRMGTLKSGEVLMSVAFEIGGKLTQPTGQVKITLPAEVLEGYALCLLSEDGAETELTLEGDAEEETVSFTLDFTNSETPVQVIRLIPEV